VASARAATESLLERRGTEIDAEIASLRQTKQELLAFRERFAEVDCPPGVEPWPCAAEFVAVADVQMKGVNRDGRNALVPTDA
jgi:hypothetical protein